MRDLASTLTACGLLLLVGLACKGGKKDESVPDPVTTAAASAPVATTDDTASAAPTESAKPIVKPKATAMSIPTPTTDRIPRNRDKDPPCPLKFTEQPGVEQYSTCARDCKTDSDCHGHKCDDSMVGDGKVCSEETVVRMEFMGTGGKCPAGYSMGPLDTTQPNICRKECKSQADCTGKYTCTDDHYCYSL